MDGSREANFHIGIDLGTTNTVVAICNKSRSEIYRPRPVSVNQEIASNNIGSSENLPSVLFFDKDGKIIVGEYARSKKRDGASSRILYNTKIDMGQKVTYQNGFTPVKAASEILKVCYKAIKAHTPRGMSFPKVTITVPASFDQNQIADTVEASREAGFDPANVSILEEPVAALLHYINGQRVSGDEDQVDFSTPKRVMVYDIGGGTCDVCVVDMDISSVGEKSVYHVQFKATNRYTEFGGNDFDEAASIGLLNKLFQTYHIPETSISADVKNDLVSRILPYAESDKIWYANQISVNGMEDVEDAPVGYLDDFLGHKNVPLELPFADYQKYTQIFFEDNYTHPTRKLTDKMSNKNVIKPVYKIMQTLQNIDQRPIDCVFLTGGMSLYPPIEEALANFCKVPIIKTDDPMKAVALGAAMSVYITMDANKDSQQVEVEAGGSSDDNQAAMDSRPKLAESIFIDIENHLPMKIIDAATSIPCKGVVPYTFKVSAAKVRFNLFAGTSDHDPEMRILYDYARKFDHIVKPNTKAVIQYEIDRNRFLRMFLVLQDERQQTYELTVDTTQ